MKFTFENLGPIDEAEIELADLTLICGENNTGKTYLTYAIYGFLQSWRQLMADVLEQEITQIKLEKGGRKIYFRELFVGKKDYFLDACSKRFIPMLSELFATGDVAFTNAKVALESATDFITDTLIQTLVDEPNEEITLFDADEISLSGVVSGESGVKSNIPLITGPNIKVRMLAQLISLKANWLSVFLTSVERTGIAIFRREIDAANSRFVDEFRQSHLQTKPPGFFFSKLGTGHPWPVRDNLEFVRNLETLDKQTSPIAKSHPELIEAFNAVSGGRYSVSRETGLHYQPNASKQTSLPMSSSSSSVRALVDLGFYLRCQAKPGDLYIIDEPELNLHPKNQRAMARLIARMVNAGIKVMLTTHSDYLVKELNTLIMLAQKTPHTIAVQHNHHYDDAELLKPEQIHLYTTCTEPEMTKSGKPSKRKFINTVKRANIYPDRGIEVSTFDTTIDEMNALQSEILYGGDL